MQRFILFLFVVCVGVTWAQVGPDQPYMLVYQAPVCSSPFTYSTTPFSTITPYQQGCPKQIQVLYFSTLEKAIDRLNERTAWITSNAFGVNAMTEPAIISGDVIGLFKVKRIPVAIQPSGKKTKVIEQVPQEFERDVLEWKAQQ